MSGSGKARHRVEVRKHPAGVQALIELRLRVRTEVRWEGWAWAIYFDAPPDVDLDFLRPAVLPPLEANDA